MLFWKLILKESRKSPVFLLFLPFAQGNDPISSDWTHRMFLSFKLIIFWLSSSIYSQREREGREKYGKQKTNCAVYTFLAPSETDWMVLGWAWQTWIWRETRPGKAAQMARADPGVSWCCWSICCWSGPVVSKAVASDRDGCCTSSGGEEPDSPKCLQSKERRVSSFTTFGIADWAHHLTVLS